MHLPQSRLLCLIALALTLPAWAQMNLKPTDDMNDPAAQSAASAFTVGATGINQAPNLAKPTDTLSTLTRELGKTGSAAQAPSQSGKPAARSRTAARAEPPTQFQQFVTEATGKTLKHFGAELFDSPENYSPDESLPVPASYVLGPGDEVQLQVWGPVDFSATLVLDRNGKVLIPKVGAVALTGVAVRDLEATLRTSLAKVFTNFNLNANLGRLRSIQVYVMGQARQPGAYVVSSLSTLINTLFASGGPSSHGSMRAIELQRDGKTIATLDLYDLIARGDKSRDTSLQPGDVIVIPPAGPRVAVTGAFDHTGIYELKGTAATLADILNLHGGTPTFTNTHRALLERVAANQTPSRQVTALALDAAGLRQPLRDGDVITLLPLDRAFANAVTLRGNVAQPMRYPFQSGMRVSDLIPEPAALIQKDYFTRKNAMVQYESGKVVSAERVVNEVKNLLEEINWDYAAIERMDAQEVRTQLIPFNLGKAIKTKDPAHNLLLLPGDVVTVFGVNDLAVPAEKRTQFVRVSGEVMVPGIYQLLPGETLPQILQRAGGLSQNAFLYGTNFTRESTRAQQQANLDKSIRRMESDLANQTATVLQNVSDSANGSSMQAQLAGQKLLLGRMQGLKASGRIALELDPNEPMLPAIALQDGDAIVVPQRPSFVSVFGEVQAENAFIHKPAYSVADYLDKAGLARTADVDAVMLVRADGTVESDAARAFTLFGSGIMGKRLNPGDSIFVPGVMDRRTAYSRFIEGAKDWTAIFYQFGLGAAGIKTLRN